MSEQSLFEQALFAGKTNEIWTSTIKISGCHALPLKESALDLMHQDFATAAVFDRLGVPEALFGGWQLL